MRKVRLGGGPGYGGERRALTMVRRSEKKGRTKNVENYLR